VDKRILALIALTVLVSGCTSLIETENSPEGIEPDPGKGLEMTGLNTTDDELRAGQGDRQGQRAEITMVLSNHHEKEIDPEIELTNTGALEADDGSADENCNKNELDPVREETVDQMRCSWGIRAPSQSALGAFESKQEYVSVVITYDSQVTNREPLTFQFMNRDDIESSDTVTRKFSNNEVTLTIEADNPAAMDRRYNQFEIEMRNSGSGSVQSDEYDFEYNPESIFTHDGELLCPDNGRKRNTEDDEFTDDCSFNVASESQRNVFVSADYKYQRQQTIPINIVR